MSNAFTGLWHITESPDFSVSDLNLEIQAYIRIDADGHGEFQFIYVYGCIIPRTSKQTKGRAKSEFNFDWDGQDKCDPVSGRGTLTLLAANTLKCDLSFHHGDDYELIAKKVSS
ncbi:hypothetical protein [Synechococcus sp. PCC 6312]|uniref:hypothetical protein n=1 Tax=Synechococcus sp. (strain ATCC 27167 / PCC 6312) TaxID=195253 RepID=UPI00029F4429|nr:hypothetical protein [Synechococcus sp. PCC 6312]AFY59816.1 hypothetical protein Syn6312_0595 [Synechococcus sp. PCC 6312]